MNADLQQLAGLRQAGLPDDPRDAEDRGPGLQSRHLLTLRVDLPPERRLGRTPFGTRRIFEIAGGRLEGRVSGTVLPSGGDWALQGTDGCLRLDIRGVAELDDGALLCLTAQGRVAFLPDELSILADRRAAAELDTSRYYYRLAPLFETASARYAWLNRILAVGVGRFTRGGAACEVYEIL